MRNFTKTLVAFIFSACVYGGAQAAAEYRPDPIVRNGMTTGPMTPITTTIMKRTTITAQDLIAVRDPLTVMIIAATATDDAMTTDMTIAVIAPATAARAAAWSTGKPTEPAIAHALFWWKKSTGRAQAVNSSSVLFSPKARKPITCRANACAASRAATAPAMRGSSFFKHNNDKTPRLLNYSRGVSLLICCPR